MAQVRWTMKSDHLFDTYVFNAFFEFGQKTSKKWMQERIAFADLVAKHPEACPPEALLADRRRYYRSCLIMRGFKIVYYYAKSSDTVHVVDIWDTRMSPDNLRQRIK